jgi:hypothetical protein
MRGRVNRLGLPNQKSGRGAAWLARLLGVQEVPSSNLGGPTKLLKELQTPPSSTTPSWSPFRVQAESTPRGTHRVPADYRPKLCVSNRVVSRGCMGAVPSLVRWWREHCISYKGTTTRGPHVPRRYMPGSAEVPANFPGLVGPSRLGIPSSTRTDSRSPVRPPNQ